MSPGRVKTRARMVSFGMRRFPETSIFSIVWPVWAVWETPRVLRLMKKKAKKHTLNAKDRVRQAHLRLGSFKDNKILTTSATVGTNKIQMALAHPRTIT